MSNPTTPFGWQMPTATDLVTDLPADFAVFGQAVATSMGDLLGGTTGQVLAKASNADMDFVWSADAAGMTNPMTTTGDTIYSSSGSTPARLGIGSTGQGLAVVAGIPAWTASATSTLTTTGDMLYASAANTLARVGVGTTGQVLTVASGVPSWATPAASGGMTLLSTTAVTAVSSVSITSINQTYNQLVIVLENMATTNTGVTINATFNSITTAGQYAYFTSGQGSGSGQNASNIPFVISATNSANVNDISAVLNIVRYAATPRKSLTFYSSYTNLSNPPPPSDISFGGGTFKGTSISSVQINVSAGNFTAQGNIYIYGVK